MSMDLEVIDIGKCYARSEVWALMNISFKVQPNRFLGLLGENGSGKTTLISIICGLLKPNTGQVIFPENIDPKKDIALVPQEIALYPTLTLFENLRFFAGIYGIYGKYLKNAIARVVTLVQLGDHLHQPVDQFSGGMKRRANLAITLLNCPKLILLDEPTVHVDPVSREVIFAGLKELNKAGTTIIYTSHHMDEIEKLCSEVIILHKGLIVAENTPQGLIGANPDCKDLNDVFIKLVRD